MIKKIFCFVLVILTLLSCMTACAASRETYDELSDLGETPRLGTVEGSIYNGYSKEMFPNAEFETHGIFPNLFQRLLDDGIDGFLLDEPNFNAVNREAGGCKSIVVPQYGVEIGFAFPKNEKGEKLQAQMNELLVKLKADGTVDRLIDKWYGTTEPTETVISPDFSDNPTPIVLAVDAGRKPFVYKKNGEYAGFEIEVLYAFFEEYGYNPTIYNTGFASAMAGLGTTYDIAGGGIYITAERKQKVNFAEAYMNAPVVMVVKDNDADTAATGFIEGFRKTFIDENRFLDILEGIGVTLLITFASALFGTALGFGVFMLCRRFRRVAVKITKAVSIIINGMPVVIFLMLLYFVVFGKIDISNIIVAIIGFSLTVATFVVDKLTIAVDSVDAGQTEAALAMGFTKNGAFFSIILPQALKMFMPLYQSEMVLLLKTTAIVGYIAVEDLTKVSQLIISSTFEAIFPMLFSAIIYLLFAWGLSKLIGAIRFKIEPKNRDRSKILKGVNLK